MMSEHDRDNCGLCYDRRASRLRRRGLSHRLIRELRQCGPAGLPMVKVIEDATPEQIEKLNCARDLAAVSSAVSNEEQP